MRLVVEYTVGDMCTYHCTDSVPVEYESAEAFLVDFERAVLDRKDFAWDQDLVFTLGGQEFNAGDFYAVDSNHHRIINSRTGNPNLWLPEVYTVDEWFEQKCCKNTT